MTRTPTDTVETSEHAALLRERVAFCCRLARLLQRTLAGTRLAELRPADRSRLDRALLRLQSDLSLARTITGGIPVSARRRDG